MELKSYTKRFEKVVGENVYTFAVFVSSEDAGYWLRKNDDEIENVIEEGNFDSEEFDFIIKHTINLIEHKITQYEGE